MAMPVGLALGRIKNFADVVLPKERRFPTACNSTKHEEWIDLAFSKDMKISRVPKAVSFAKANLLYKSTYELMGQMLKVKRSFLYGDLQRQGLW
jgi:hypothetical protein